MNVKYKDYVEWDMSLSAWYSSSHVFPLKMRSWLPVCSKRQNFKILYAFYVCHNAHKVKEKISFSIKVS